MISDVELVELSEKIYSLILDGVHLTSEMVRRRRRIYWGDNWFIEEYHNTQKALELLENSNRVRKENSITEVNGKEVKIISYYPKFRR
jgi:hypothetical protein